MEVLVTGVQTCALPIFLLTLFSWLLIPALLLESTKWLWARRKNFTKEMKSEWAQFRCQHENNTLEIHPKYSDIRHRACHDCGLVYGDKMTSFERHELRRGMRKASLGF
jgi:hypothetical protein